MGEQGRASLSREAERHFEITLEQYYLGSRLRGRLGAGGGGTYILFLLPPSLDARPRIDVTVSAAPQSEQLPIQRLHHKARRPWPRRKKKNAAKVALRL